MGDSERGTAGLKTVVTAIGEARNLGVWFAPQGDRFGHVWFTEQDGLRQILVHSLEGPDGQDWPASPVLQQLDRCSLGDDRWGLVALGMAGSSHWSLAVDSRPDGSIRFDVACRAKARPLFLGSSYELAEAVQVHHTEPQRLVLSPAQDARSVFEVLAVEGRLLLAGDGTRFSIQPTAVRDAWPATVRWEYRVRGLPSNFQPA